MSKNKKLGVTALMILEAEKRQIKTRSELAYECGWENPGVLSMILSGAMRVPMERVPAIARVFGLDKAELLVTLLKEYRESEWKVLEECWGLPATLTTRVHAT